MRGNACVFAVLCSLGFGSTALAQESRTMGHRLVAVGDTVHRTQDMSLDAEMTMSIENVTTAPVVMKMRMGDVFDLNIEAIRVPTDPRGAVYRVEVLRLEKMSSTKGTEVSSLVGRTVVVDVAKHKVKPTEGAKLTSEELTQLFETMDSLGNPFVGGGARWTGEVPPTYTVGQHVDPALLDAGLPSDLPSDVTVVVRGFEAGPGGERVIMDVAVGGTVMSEGVPMDVHLTGTIQFDVATGWPLGADVRGNVRVEDTTVTTDAMDMHLSMKGPMQVLMGLDFITADGREFGYHPN